MTLETKLAQLVPEIEGAMQACLAGLAFGPSGELRRMLTYHLGWAEGASAAGGRGKRIRPVLTLLCAGALGGDYPRALPAAVAIELLHNFTLIHDDIEDRSEVRHGRPTLWTRWGLAQAVNAGDALFSIAQLALLGLAETCGDGAAVQAARQMNRMCLALTRGQYLDMAFEEQDAIDLATYLAMIEGKTAALIAFAAEMGGLAAGQDADTQQRLADFGHSLGMAFQIQDDYLGIWGDPRVTGKSAASDLLARKKSLPILFGLGECAEFRELWQAEDLDPALVSKMADLLVDCGAAAYVTGRAGDYTQRAFDDLARLFPKPNADADALGALTETLLHRKA